MRTSITNDTLLNLAGKYGTPLYVYDMNLISEKYKEMCNLLKWPELRIFYAMKANYNFQILRRLKELGSGIDAVSPGDVLLALKAGFAPEDIIYTASSTSLTEMEKIAKLGILQNIDTLSSLELFGKHLPGQKVSIRFNTGIALGEHEFVITGGEDSKFGILTNDLPEVLKIVREYNLKVVGIHEHIGSGIDDTEKVFESVEKLLAISGKENFPDLEFVDLGGGFKVPYKPEEKRIDYSAFGKKISAMFSIFCEEYGRELKLYFEPGKYLVAEAGYLITQVNTVKKAGGKIIVGTNSGFTQLIRPVFYGSYHHILNLNNHTGKPQIYDVFGNICEAGDFLAKDRSLPEVRENDYLAVLNAGAYCYSMGSVYNLRPMPAEVIINDGKDVLSRKALSYEELINQIISESA